MLSRLDPHERSAKGGVGPLPFRAPENERSWRVILTGAVAGLVCLCGGTLIGLALTYNAVHRWHDVGAIQIGAWSMSPTDGTPGINPYQRVRFAASGQIPMAASQGVALIAYADDAGRKLERGCSYRLSGPVPQARFWTLGAVDPAGHAIDNAAARSAFTSEDVLRDGNGGFTIAIAPAAEPGNWLPVGGTGRFVLVLRLYDTAVTTLRGRDLRAIPVPTIAAIACR